METFFFGIETKKCVCNVLNKKIIKYEKGKNREKKVGERNKLMRRNVLTYSTKEGNDYTTMKRTKMVK